jgi:hypothetical protein
MNWSNPKFVEGRTEYTPIAHLSIHGPQRHRDTEANASPAALRRQRS